MAQIMKLSYFPQIKVVHTSKTFHGQLYVPMLNWLMMIGTVLVAGIYNNTTSLGNAYGVCVMFVTFFDTCMVSLAALMVWRIKPYYVILPWLTIAAMDGTFLSSALTKVPQGAWFTIALAIILASLFILWRYGKENQWRAEAEDRYPTTHFVRRKDDGGSALTEKYGGTDLTTIKGFGVFFDKAGETTPIVFSQFVTKLAAMPEVMVFFHLRPLEQPTVPVEDRFTVSKLAIPNCYRLVVRHGYMDEIITPDLAALIVEKVRDFIIIRRTTKKDKISPDAHAERDAAHQAGSSSREKQPMPDADDDSDNVSINLARLESSFAHQVLYVIGKEQMKIDKTKGLWRRFLLSIFLFVRENTRTKMASLKVPTEKVVEVGFVKDV
jgi:KUP system potassium uptake protein